jgi:hypothetical protein
MATAEATVNRIHTALDTIANRLLGYAPWVRLKPKIDRRSVLCTDRRKHRPKQNTPISPIRIDPSSQRISDKDHPSPIQSIDEDRRRYMVALPCQNVESARISIRGTTLRDKNSIKSWTNLGRSWEGSWNDD